MASDTTRMLRGALAGAAAAAVWAAQQPLDKRVFGVDYDDAELLGSLITRKRSAPLTLPLGTAIHVANGALFGAAYAQLAHFGPGQGIRQGLGAGVGEHLATWPAMRLMHLHPAAREF